MTTAIKRKQAEIDDAKGWVADLRELNPTSAEIVNATNYVILLQDDLKRMEEGSS
tara:strand:+ start:162 stop:326 length:165 start_codon:yes stop_codon:yes gene_type:complete